MRLHEIESLLEAATPLAQGTTYSDNTGEYTYNASTNKWINSRTQTAAKGLQHNKIMQAKGMNPSGQPLKPSLGQRISAKLGGPFAQATSADPKAGIVQKGMAKLGSALGRGVAALVRPKAGEPAPEQPAAEQPGAGKFAGAGVAATPDKTTAPTTDTFELAKGQLRQMQPAPGAKALPPKMVVSLQADMKKMAYGDKESGVFAADKILKFAKAGYDVSKLQPEWLANAKAGERSLTREAYQQITAMLESHGLTWNNLGITVRIDESVSDYVFIMSKDIANLKVRAGI
jgi:hypothetical protein